MAEDYVSLDGGGYEFPNFTYDWNMPAGFGVYADGPVGVPGMGDPDGWAQYRQGERQALGPTSLPAADSGGAGLGDWLKFLSSGFGLGTQVAGLFQPQPGVGQSQSQAQTQESTEGQGGGSFQPGQTTDLGVSIDPQFLAGQAGMTDVDQWLRMILQQEGRG